MKQLLDKSALVIFSLMAALKGYHFKKVDTLQECSDANRLYEQETSASGNQVKEKINLYRTGKICFIAYHQGKPVAAVKLADSWIANQPREIYGLVEYCISYDIQDLIIKKTDMKTERFIMMGLFKTMYSFSTKHSVLCWNSAKSRNVYKVLSGFCLDVKTNHEISNRPSKDYLHTKKIKDSSFSIQLASIDPFGSLKKHIIKWAIKQRVPHWSGAQKFSVGAA